MFERFTAAAREVVVSAQVHARQLGHHQIGAEHLLLALLEGGPDDSAAQVLHDLGLNHARVSEQVARLAANGGSVDADALRTIGVDLDEVRRAVEQLFGPGALDQAGARRSRWPLRGSRFSGGHIPFTDSAKKCLELSLREAIARRDRSIGTEHLLLAVLRAQSRTVSAVLTALGVAPQDLRRRLEERLHGAA